MGVITGLTVTVMVLDVSEQPFRSVVITLTFSEVVTLMEEVVRPDETLLNSQL